MPCGIPLFAQQLNSGACDVHGLLSSHLPWVTLERVCDTLPSTTALREFDESGAAARSLSYRDIKEQTLKVCEKLQRWGVRPGDRVLLLYPPCADFHVAFWSCLRFGAIAVPAAPPLPMSLATDLRRLTKIISDCQPVVVLTIASYHMFMTSTSFAGHKWPSGGSVRVYPSVVGDWRQHFMGSQRFKDTDRNIQPGDVAYLQYTSGSTSDPKGVMISHANLLHNLLLGYCIGTDVEQNVAEPGEQVLSWVPQFHDMGLVGVAYGLLSGFTVNVVHTLLVMKDPLALLRIVHQTRTIRMSTNNAAMEMIAKKWESTPPSRRPVIDLSCLQMIVAGGENIMKGTVDRLTAALESVGLPRNSVYPVYGIAEHVVSVSCRRFGTPLTWCPKTQLLSQGHPPQPEVDVKIVDTTTLKPVPVGQIGEVWLSSPSKGLGYYDKPDINKQVFEAVLHPDCGMPVTYLRTGDLGYMGPQGLFLCGRIKDTIIVGGRNIYPQDIEEAVADTFSVLRRGRCVAVSLNNDSTLGDHQQTIGVACEVRPPFPGAKECQKLCMQIMEHVQETFAIPVALVALVLPRSLPTTTSGKLQRGQTRDAMNSGTLALLEGGLLTKEDTQTCVNWLKGFPSCSAASAVSSVFEDHGIFNPEVPITRQGVTSVDIVPMICQLQEVSEVQLNIQDMSTMTAEEVHALCVKSLALRTMWRTTVKAATLAAQVSDGNRRSTVGDTREQTTARKRWQSATVSVLMLHVQQQCRELIAQVGPVQAKIEKNSKVLIHRPSQQDTPIGKPLPFGVRVVLQALGIFLVSLIAAVAVLPAYYFAAYALYDSGLGRPWLYLAMLSDVGFGSGGLLWPFMVVIWQATLTLETIVVKWLLIGRYKSGTWSMWSPYFLRWWFVDRLMDFWEMWVGMYIKGSMFLNLFYKLMGANVSWTSILPETLREFDCVTVGSATEIIGKVVPRILSPGRLWVGTVSIGSGCTLKSKSFVQGQTVIGDNSTFQELSVVLEGMKILEGSNVSGNPARTLSVDPQSKDAADTRGRAANNSWLLILKAVLLCPVLVVALSVSTAPVTLVWDAVGVPDFMYLPLLYWITWWLWMWLMAGLMAALLKWTLLPNLRPGATLHAGWWLTIRCWVVDTLWEWFDVHISSLIAFTPLSAAWLWLLGMKINIFLSVLVGGIGSASGACCVDMAAGAYDASEGLGTSVAVKQGEAKQTYLLTRIKQGSLIGLQSCLGPGVTVGRGCVIGSSSKVTSDVADGCYVVGNGTLIMGSAPPGPLTTLKPMARRQLLFRVACLRVLQMFCRCISIGFLLLFGLFPAYNLIILLFYDGDMWFWKESNPHYTLPRAVACLLLSGVYLVFCAGLLAWGGVITYLVRWAVGAREKLDGWSLRGMAYQDYVCHWYMVRGIALSLFCGSAWSVAYHKLLGADVPWDVYIGTSLMYDHHLVHIGAGSVLDDESYVMGHIAEDATTLALRTCSLGKESEIQQFAVACAGDSLPDNVVLGVRAKNFGGMKVASSSLLYGTPARAAVVVSADV